jgi:hypothetical protein
MQVESFRMQVNDGSLLLEFDGTDQYLHPFYAKCVNSVNNSWRPPSENSHNFQSQCRFGRFGCGVVSGLGERKSGWEVCEAGVLCGTPGQNAQNNSKILAKRILHNSNFEEAMLYRQTSKRSPRNHRQPGRPLWPSRPDCIPERERRNAVPREGNGVAPSFAAVSKGHAARQVLA